MPWGRAPFFDAYLDTRNSSAKWQAAWWDGVNDRSTGFSDWQRALARGQRGWKGHPFGGFIGEGISPVTMTLSFCSSPRLPTDAISAWVYGCSGWFTMSAVS